MIKFRRMREDDTCFGHKKGEIVVIETNFDWDPEKVICIGKLIPHNDHSFYTGQLDLVTYEELLEIVTYKNDDNNEK